MAAFLNSFQRQGIWVRGMALPEDVPEVKISQPGKPVAHELAEEDLC